VEALLARTDELARRWAIGLILALPLERIGELPLETFAREAPSLCAQVVRALGSDEELERMASRSESRGAASPARRLAQMTGARDGTEAVEVVETLRGVLWDALLDELRWSSVDRLASARMVADLADRLAYVCSIALVSSLTESPAAHASARVAQADAQPARAGVQVARAGVQNASAGADAVRAGLARARSDFAAAAIASGAPPHQDAGRGVQRASLGSGVVIVDEAQPPLRRSHVGARAPDAKGGAVTPRVPVPDATHRRTRGRALPWDTPLERPIDVRDERG
jgi:hypothetical protein